MPALSVKQILHLDFDSFFASVEQQYNPKLRNQPIGVTAKNGRTCIIASSREAKKLGIKTGFRTYDALKICPSMIFIPADFVKYLEISKKFLRICEEYSPFIELFSIDELFMDITSTLHLFGGVNNLVKQIKTRIKREIGEFITVSVGLSQNKLLAKLASGINKPNGFFEINHQNLLRVYAKADLTDVCGVGERIKRRLNYIGINSLPDLQKAPLRMLVTEFGQVEGRFLKEIGLGLGSSEILDCTLPTEVKSVGRNYCLPKNETNQRIILQNINELCEEVALKLRRLRKKTRTVGLYLGGTFKHRCRKTFDDYFDQGSEIFHVCLNFYHKWQPQMVRQISVWATNLEDKKNLTASLLGVNQKKERITKIVDFLNEKFGDHTIRNGFLLNANKLTTVPNGFMADKYERAKISKEFKAFFAEENGLQREPFL